MSAMWDFEKWPGGFRNCKKLPEKYVCVTRLISYLLVLHKGK